MNKSKSVMLNEMKHLFDILKLFRCLIIISLILTAAVFGQNIQEPEELIPVELRAGGIGKKNIDIILKQNIPYLPLITTFEFLGINIILDPNNQRVEGFFISAESTFIIDSRNGYARFWKNQYTITPDDYIWKENELFLQLDVLSRIFKLDVKYLPRRLTVEFRKISNLPVFKKKQRTQMFMRKAAKRISIPDADQYLGREFSLFGDGRLDWSLKSNYLTNNDIRTRYNFSLGLQLLGGDLDLDLWGYHYTKTRLRKRLPTLRGHFRYPIFDTPYLRQIIIGDIKQSGYNSPQTRGIEITNRPFTQRYFFATEYFEGHLEPGTEIEFFNIGYDPQLVKVGSSGNYRIEVPLIYGRREIVLNAYDPWEQLRRFPHRFNIPQAIVPVSDIEYSLSVGRMRYRTDAVIAKNYVRWGVTSRFTMGMNMEYVDDKKYNNQFITAITATSLLGNGLTLNAFASPNAISNIEANWLYLTDGDLTIGSTYYGRNQIYNPSERSRGYYANLRQSFPVLKRPLGLNIGASQYHYGKWYSNDVRMNVSFFFTNISRFQISGRLGETHEVEGSVKTYAKETSVLLSLFLPLEVNLNIGGSYEHNRKRTEYFNISVFKSITTAFQLQVNYLRVPYLDYYNASLQLSYFFPYFRLYAGANKTQSQKIGYSLAGRGSVFWDIESPAVYFSKQVTSTGYGGIAVYPYLDMNADGVYDLGDSLITKGNIYLTNLTRKTLPSRQSITSPSLSRLAYYEEYNVFFDNSSVEDISFVSMNGSYNVLSEPNSLKEILIPLVRGGTIRGIILIDERTAKVPAPGIKVSLTPLGSREGQKPYSTKTFSTGEFEIVNIPPGSYRLKIDTQQLEELGYRADKASYDVDVTTTIEGDLIENMNFVLRPK